MEGIGDGDAVEGDGLLEGNGTVQRDEVMAGEGAAGDESAGGMDFDGGWMIDGEELDGVEVEDFAEFLGDLEGEKAVFWNEGTGVADADDFLGIRLDVAAWGNGQTDRSGAEEIGDESEAGAVPGIEVGTGTGGDGEFDEVEDDAGFDGDVDGGKLGVEPADGDGIELGLFADADFDGELLDGAKGAPGTGADLDAGAQAGEIGAVAEESDLDGVVGIAAVIAEEAEAAAGKGNDEIGVAVLVEVGGDEVGDFGQALETVFAGDLGEAEAPAIAPEPDAFTAPGEDIEPAIVVEVDEAEMGEAMIAGGEPSGIAEAAEVDVDGLVGEQGDVVAEIVVEIAGGEGAGHGPVVGLIGGGEGTAALIEQDEGRLVFAGE